MPGGEKARLVLLGSLIQVQQGRVSGGREKRAAGYPVQNNSHGYERFFVPRIGCIFVDGDSSLNTPGAEPRRVCAVHKALGAGSPGWSSHSPAGGGGGLCRPWLQAGETKVMLLSGPAHKGG